MDQEPKSGPITDDFVKFKKQDLLDLKIELNGVQNDIDQLIWDGEEFTDLPSNLYIRGDRYEVRIDRILTPRFTKDVDAENVKLGPS